MNSKIKKPVGRKIVKLTQDDVLREVMEAVAKKYGYGTFMSKLEIIGTPGNDFRVICVIDDEDDYLRDISFDELDRSIEFNW